MEKSTTSRNCGIRVWALFRHYYPNFAGAAIQGHQVLCRMVGQGFSVQVLAAADHAARNLAGQEVVMDGLTVRYLPVVRHKDWAFWTRFPLLKKLVSLCNDLASDFSLSLKSAWILWSEGCNGDIVQLYSCNDFSFLIVWLARVRDMHPVIRMTLVGSRDDPVSFHRGFKRVLGVLRLEAFRRAEAIVSISSALTDSCLLAGVNPDKVFQIPNGVDLQKHHPLNRSAQANLRAALGLDLDRRYIAFVGAALYRKGVDILIEAFVRIARQIDDVDLVIVGPYDFSDHTRYAPELQKLVDELQQKLMRAGCSRRVFWAGEVDNVYQYLQAADVFCLPTRREGLGTAVAEAMAVGLPVVIARLEGVTTDFFSLENEGVLVAGHDTLDYADALMKLLRDEPVVSNMGNRARIRAAAEFDIELAVQRYAELYRGLVGGTCA